MPPAKRGAVGDELVGAGQAVLDGGAGRLGLGDAAVELGEFALVELAPAVGGAGGGEGGDLLEGAADAAEQEHEADLFDG
ncbi:hypothetical protein GCM10020001_101530 [Nonomuraea salmonea]